MENIRNLVKRIGQEAETVEDMTQLLLSELDAYEALDAFKIGKITLYPESKVVGDHVIVGDLDGMDIALKQKIVNEELRSVYFKYK